MWLTCSAGTVSGSACWRSCSSSSSRISRDDHGQVVLDERRALRRISRPPMTVAGTKMTSTATRGP